MSGGNEVWMWTHQKYGMSRIVQELYSIETRNCSCLSQTKEDRLNIRRRKFEWCSMNVSASKIWNELNWTKIYSVETKNCSYLTVTNDGWLFW